MDRGGEAIPVRIDILRVESDGDELLLVSFIDAPKRE
jgi:hypothetical protein